MMKNRCVDKLEELKNYCKKYRQFDVNSVLNKKIKLINKFFKEEWLDSVVVGISWWIDSAVVLKLLLEASKINWSPLKKVYALFMPIYSWWITDQDKALFYVNKLMDTCKTYNSLIFKLLDLTKIAENYYSVLDVNNEWVKWQIWVIVRTPALYWYAAKIQYEESLKSIVVGTTNKDEWSYIWFFWKASDAMVDLQPIADLHKSEVYALARKLNIPEEIISRKPQGDVWDKKKDEEMIWAPYWFLELYTLLIESNKKHLLNDIIDCDNIRKWINNIETIHKKNFHKYKVWSPARYIDVLNRKVI